VASTADRDKDGVLDQTDACPGQPRGRFDFNKNGCPGPYRLIKPKLNWGKVEIKPVEGIVTIYSIAFSRLPVGAVVTLQAGSRLSEKLRVPKSRTVRSTRIASIHFKGGETFRIRIVQPGSIGFDGVMEVSMSRRPFLIREQCIPAVGPPAPVRCGGVNRGK
jgi:hypothetical protein